jgi:hypothetical protein
LGEGDGVGEGVAAADRLPDVSVGEDRVVKRRV